MPSDPPLLIAVTGYGQTHDRVLSKAAGFAHHLVKPADPAVIVELVAAAAAQRKPARVAGRA
jgi:two-component system CheB/CheR fusion protein